MYRIILAEDNKAYATECDNEFNVKCQGHDNLFDQKIYECMKNKCDVIILCELGRFKKYFPNYELFII